MISRIDAGKKPLLPKRPSPPPSPAPAARAGVSYAVPADEPIHSYAVGFRFLVCKSQDEQHNQPPHDQRDRCGGCAFMRVSFKCVLIDNTGQVQNNF